jgi:hypothetical protein
MKVVEFLGVPRVNLAFDSWNGIRDNEYSRAHCQIESRPREDRPSTADRREKWRCPCFPLNLSFGATGFCVRARVADRERGLDDSKTR